MPTKVIFAAIETDEEFAPVEVNDSDPFLQLIAGGFRFPADFDWTAAIKDSGIILDDAARAEIAAAIEQLVAERRMWARAPKAADVRKQFQDVDDALATVKAKLGELDQHGQAALEQFLGGEEGMVAVDAGLGRLRRGLAKGLQHEGGLPVPQDVPSAGIIATLVECVAPIVERTTDRKAAATPGGPFVRLMRKLHDDALPEDQKHQPRKRRRQAASEVDSDPVGVSLAKAAEAYRKRVAEAAHAKVAAQVWLVEHASAAVTLVRLGYTGGCAEAGLIEQSDENELVAAGLLVRWPKERPRYIGLSRLAEIILSEARIGTGHTKSGPEK